MTLFDSGNNRRGKVDGVMIGVVTDNQDPDSLGRVKLKLPVLDGENETDWVRIATLMGGDDRGSLFIPEVDDEVLVAFQMGNIGQPVVIGSLWNDQQKPPEGTEENDIRTFKSRAGHEITFNDSDDDGKVTIATTKGHTIELGDKEDTLTVKDSNDSNSLEIKGGSTNEITVKSNSSTVTIKGTGEISIESDSSLSIKSMGVNIEGTGNIKLKGGMVDIQSDGMVKINGSMVKIN